MNLNIFIFLVYSRMTETGWLCCLQKEKCNESSVSLTFLQYIWKNEYSFITTLLFWFKITHHYMCTTCISTRLSHQLSVFLREMFFVFSSSLPLSTITPHNGDIIVLIELKSTLSHTTRMLSQQLPSLHGIKRLHSKEMHIHSFSSSSLLLQYDV
jgi:hypothetical protein